MDIAFHLMAYCDKLMFFFFFFFFFFFLFFWENRIWQFMQIVSTGDNLYNCQNFFFWEKWKKIFQTVVCPECSALDQKYTSVYTARCLTSFFLTKRTLPLAYSYYQMILLYFYFFFFFKFRSLWTLSLSPCHAEKITMPRPVLIFS